MDERTRLCVECVREILAQPPDGVPPQPSYEEDREAALRRMRERMAAVHEQVERTLAALEALYGERRRQQ